MSDPILVVPGQTVAQSDWDALVAQHGGLKSNQVRTPTKEERSRYEDAGEDLEQNPIYRGNFADGTYVEYRKAANGVDSMIVEYKPSARFTQQNPARQKDPNDPAERNAAELQRQRERNAALPKDQDPAYETDAERRARAEARIKQQGADAKAAEDKARQERIDQEARAARPGTKIASRTDVVNGRSVTTETWRLPDGTLEDRVDNQPVPPKAGTIVKGGGKNGEDVQAIADPTTGAISYQPIPGAVAPPTPPAEAGQFTPDITKPQMGLAEHIAALSQLRSMGKITDAQYESLARQAYDAAVAEAKRLDTIVSAQQAAATQAITQRGQDISTSVSRLGQANQATQDALSASKGLASAMTPASVAAAGGPVLPAIMALQDARGQGWGGFNQPSPVTTGQFPAWNQIAGMGVSPAPPTYGQVNAATKNAVSGFNAAVGAVLNQPPAAPAGAVPAPAFTPQPPVNLPPSTPGAAAAPPPAPPAPAAAPATQAATGTHPMYRVDLGDEYVYYEAAKHPELVNSSNVTLVDRPTSIAEGHREPKAGAAPSYAKPDAPAPAAAPTPPADTYGPGRFPGGTVLPQPDPQPPVDVPYPTSPGAQSWMGGRTIPGIASMDPLLASTLAVGGDDPSWQNAVMIAARKRGLA